MQRIRLLLVLSGCLLTLGCLGRGAGRRPAGIRQLRDRRPARDQVAARRHLPDGERAGQDAHQRLVDLARLAAVLRADVCPSRWRSRRAGPACGSSTRAIISRPIASVSIGTMPDGGDDVVLGHSAQSEFPDARVDGFSDWFVSARFAAAGSVDARLVRARIAVRLCPLRRRQCPADFRPAAARLVGRRTQAVGDTRGHGPRQALRPVRTNRLDLERHRHQRPDEPLGQALFLAGALARRLRRVAPPLPAVCPRARRRHPRRVGLRAGDQPGHDDVPVRNPGRGRRRARDDLRPLSAPVAEHRPCAPGVRVPLGARRDEAGGRPVVPDRDAVPGHLALPARGRRRRPPADGRTARGRGSCPRAATPRHLLGRQVARQDRHADPDRRGVRARPRGRRIHGSDPPAARTLARCGRTFGPSQEAKDCSPTTTAGAR